MPFFNIFSKKPLETKAKQEKPIIIADNHEKNSLVVSYLIQQGAQVNFQHLPIADYLIKNTAIERKTIQDFKSSIINKRIIRQLQELKQYPQQLLILEGLESTPYNSEIIHDNAFRGFLLSIALELQVPIIVTQSEKDTAIYLALLAKKQPKSHISLRPSRIFRSKKEQQQFILEGFPNIGPATAEKLLSHFKSLKHIFTASQVDLQSIIGKKADAFGLLD